MLLSAVEAGSLNGDILDIDGLYSDAGLPPPRCPPLVEEDVVDVSGLYRSSSSETALPPPLPAGFQAQWAPPPSKPRQGFVLVDSMIPLHLRTEETVFYEVQKVVERADPVGSPQNWKRT